MLRKTIMKFLSLILALAVTCLNWQIQAKSPELIPIEKLFKHRDILSAHLSPTGKYLAVVADTEDEAKVYMFTTKDMKPYTAPFEWNSSRFNQGKTEIGRFIWVNDERFIASLSIKLGAFDSPMSTGEYFASNADGSQKSDVSILKNALGGNSRSFYILDMLENDPKHILISDSTGGKYPIAAKLNVYSGKRKKVARSPAPYGHMFTDSEGNVLVAVGVTSDDERQVYYRATTDDDWHIIARFKTADGGMKVKGITPDNSGLYIYLPESKNRKQGYYIYNLKSKEVQLLANTPNNIDTQLIWGSGKNKHKPIGYRSHPNYPQTKFFDIASKTARTYAGLQSVFPDNDIKITDYTRDGKLALIEVKNDTNAGSFYLFDLEKTKILPLFDSRPWLKPEQLAKVEPFKFQARDGMEIHGYLTLPQGKAKNLPLVLNIHGGPYGVRDYWGFDAENQFLANRGYAVMQVNYRGSGGYGRDFEYGSYKQMGAEMQDDITDATLWAIKEGIADKDRVCIYGASYGGYAALMAVVKEPDLYQCAIPYVGVYDIKLMKYSDIADSRYGTNFLKAAWGYDDDEFLYQRSPINFLDKVKADLFFVHGEKDVRVPIEQFDAVTERLDELNYPYESYVEKKEGHGFAKFENKVKLYSKIEKFLAKHIGEERS